MTPARSIQDCTTLVDLLRFRAEYQKDALLYRFLVEGDADGPAQEVTYGQLDAQARAVAVQLQKAHAEKERALLLYPPGLEFIAAFLGCAYAGVVAVPSYPHRTISRLEAIVRDSRARFVLTTAAFRKIAESFSRQAPELAEAHWIVTDEKQEESAADWHPPDI